LVFLDFFLNVFANGVDAVFDVDELVGGGF
jgi:hypothetical protein